MSQDFSILISGASGYLGGIAAELCRELGFEVILTKGRRGSTKEHTCDLDVLSSDLPKLATQIQEKDCQAVLHFATDFSRSTSGAVVEGVIQANFLFSVKLAEAARIAGVPHFINMSSTWELTRSTLGDFSTMLTPYAASKRAFRTYLDERYGDEGFVKNVFVEETLGPTDYRDKVVPNLLRSAVAGRPFSVRNPNLGLNFALAESLASFLLEKSTWPSLPYEVGFVSYREVTLAHIAEIIEASGIGTPTLNYLLDPANVAKSPSILDVGLPIIFDVQPPPLVQIIHEMIRELAKERN